MTTKFLQDIDAGGSYDNKSPPKIYTSFLYQIFTNQYFGGGLK